MKRGMKRWVSGLLAAAMVFTGIGANAKTASAEKSTMQSYVYNGYEVTFMVTSVWDGAFNAEVKIANIGDVAINDWALVFDFDHEIQNMWNATVLEHTEDNYIVKNNGWNANIKPGEGTGFGMTVQCDGDIAFPKSFSFVMKEEAVTAQSYSAVFTLYSDWGTGCNGAIVLSNHTDESIENWQLEFDYDREIVNISNAVIVSYEQGHYVIKNAEYNADIAGNSSVHIGIVAGEGVAEECPENFTMRQTVVGDASTGMEGGSEEIPEEEETEKATSLYAFGKYNSETQKIEIEWFTNIENGKYEILYSDDNVEYIVTDVVVSETTYQYEITEDFLTKYFKVALVKDEGDRVESIPFVISSGGNGYVVCQLDSDGDNIPDEFEEIYGTDINTADTDNDGLTDYQEIYCTDTDPAKYDSVMEGVADADADIDNDGLSNADEFLVSTDPKKKDTDGDGISDYEEIYVYKTNPIEEDTDGDNLKDGDELPIGLNPNNPKTFGIPDAEYKVEQKILAESEVFAKINVDDNPYQMSVDIVAAGYVEGNLQVKETGYAKTIQNDAILGVAPELSYDNEDSIDSVTITFEISEEYLETSLALFSEEEELVGIKRFNVFKYFEELNMLLPVETEFDIEKNLVYATTDELGTYCVMDMEIWLSSFDVEEASQETPMTYSLRTVSEQNEVVFEGDMSLNASNSGLEELYVAEEKSMPDMEAAMFSSRAIVKKETPVDIVFLLQSAGTSMYDFLLQKDMIKSVMTQIYGEYADVRACVIHYKENEAMISGSFNYETWQPAMTFLDTALGRVEYTLTNEYCNRGAAFSKMGELDLRDNAAKFVFHLANGNSGIQLGFFSELDVCAENNINYTEILPMGFYYSNPNFVAMLQAAIDKTGGLSLTYSDETPGIVYEHIVGHIAPAQMSFDAIVATGWKHIVLDGVLDPNNGVDTDNDMLSDWKEVNTERISWETDGTVILPTLQQCMDFTEKVYVQEGLSRFMLSEVIGGTGSSKGTMREKISKIKNETHILPIFSDPTDKDTDGDGLLDGTALYVNDKKVAPRDPEPLTTTGPKGIWLAQIEQEKNGVIPTEYAKGEPGLEFIVNKELADYLVSVALILRDPINYSEDYVKPILMFVKEHFEGSTEIGAYLLNFIYDEDYVAYHSQINTWQRNFGYNDLYDDVFRIGSNMHYEKFDFSGAGENYVLWLWKGDYWNLQSGAEIGLYIYQDEYFGTSHYGVVDFELPMTLSLYNYYSYDSINNLFNWAPSQKQWWITGFNPRYKEPNPAKMVCIGTVDFLGYEDLFNGLKRDTESQKDLSRYMIFDDDGHTAWIMWYKGVDE